MAKITEKQEFVFNALKDFGTGTSKDLSMFIKRKYKIDMSPSSVSSAIRTLTHLGLAASSNCGAGATYYWITKNAKLED